MPLAAPVLPRLRLPLHLVNGIEAALGVALVQLLIGTLGGFHAAQLAGSGAVCASLADVPNAVVRTWHRVLAAALLGALATAVVAATRPWPLALGLGIAAIAFGGVMTLAWGARAGAVSFAPVMAAVFAMAVPATTPLPELLAWNLAGGAGYLLWSLAAGTLLQPVYRQRAVVAALDAAAALFRSRARVLDAGGAVSPNLGPRQAWIGDEAALAERLQAARDLVFVGPEAPSVRRHTAVLLRLIDLRDVLLASRLDLDLVGRDQVARRVRAHVAAELERLAASLDAASGALLRDAPWRRWAPARGGDRLAAAAAAPSSDASVPDAVPTRTGPFADMHLAPGDPRHRLLPLLARRLEHLDHAVQRLHAALQGDPPALELTRDELQRFVAPEGWPLATLRSHLRGSSPVLRHAVRAALALSSAWFIARALGWASHPYWLVLSVAVVLRGTLQDTLARRNLRVAGTVMGCLLVVLLGALPWTGVLSAAFLVSVGLAHAYATRRYVVTATAATVMALLQAHLVNPGAGFAIAERLGDTVLGAVLAWAFSYVLPSWERRAVPRLVGQALKALSDYAALALAPGAGSAVPQRLARRAAYDALAAIAGAAQRTAAEPASVRVPLTALVTIVDHGQRLMAHLSAVRLMLAHRSAEMQQPQALQALAEGREALERALAAGTDPRVEPPAAPLEQLPAEPLMQDSLPWLQRRLQAALHDALRIEAASRALLAGMA